MFRSRKPCKFASFPRTQRSFRRRSAAGGFGVLDLETTFDGSRFAIGIRNSNDKSMRLTLTVGYRVFVCDNMAFHGDFTPVRAKHSKPI